MQHLYLRQQSSARAIAALAGHFPTNQWFDRLLVPADGDIFVWKPNGEPLLCVLRGAFSGASARHAYEAIVPLARSTPQDNRGIAAGIVQHSDPALAVNRQGSRRKVGQMAAVRYRPVKLDGTVSKTNYAKLVPSFVAGYVDASPRFPYCRQTAYTNRYPERLVALLPLLVEVSHLFQSVLPTRYVAQQAMITKAPRDFVIPGTVFTTLTINRNFQTALHQDAGDLKAGFGVMLCWRFGAYTGGYYVMPQFRVAVDLYAGDVLFSDVHEWHGNTALEGSVLAYERISIVCYMREKMVQCGSQQEELVRVKRRHALLQG